MRVHVIAYGHDQFNCVHNSITKHLLLLFGPNRWLFWPNLCSFRILLSQGMNIEWHKQTSVIIAANIKFPVPPALLTCLALYLQLLLLLKFNVVNTKRTLHLIKKLKTNQVNINIISHDCYSLWLVFIILAYALTLFQLV